MLCSEYVFKKYVLLSSMYVEMLVMYVWWFWLDACEIL